jgi:PQQ enzyme repeat
VPVLTQHYDSRRTGANLAETTLSPATIAPGKFAKLFAMAVAGHVYAQPLHVDDVDVPGLGTRNLLYVATMHNRLYAFDAETGTLVWSRSLGPHVSLPDGNIGPPDYRDISDAIGILGTPVISPDRKVIYAVAMTHEGTQYHHRLHALDLATGQHRLGGPVAIQATVPGTGDGSVNATLTFASHRHNQRPALLLANDTIYVAFASYGDQNPFHGWVFGFDADTLERRSNVFVTTRHGGRGGIWMAGQGPAADESGAVYVVTGNGTFAQTNLVDKLVLGETAVGHPALANQDGQLVLGWTDADAPHRIRLARSGDGRSITDTVTLAETSVDGPALASNGARLFLAWTGTSDEHTLNVGSSADSESLTSKVTLGERSRYGPALAFGDDKLFLAWTGLDQRLNIASSVDGTTFQHKTTLGQTTDTAPGLAFAGGRLFLLWRGTDADRRLNLTTSTDGVTFSAVTTFGATSDSHPALTLHADGLRLAWTGRNQGHNLNLASGDSTTALLSPDTYADAARSAPALAVLDGRLFLSWVGTDVAGHVNLAQVSDEPSLGDSVVKLAPDLSLLDWFSPWNNHQLDANDTDLGSGGALVLPDTDLVVCGGKEGKIYILDPHDLGRFCSTCGAPDGDIQIDQWFQATGTNKGAQTPPTPAPMSGDLHHLHGSPVHWRTSTAGTRIYLWGEADWLRAFRLHGSTFDPQPDDISDVTTPGGSMPGAMLTLTADADKAGTGVIWASHPIALNANQAVVPGMLRALDADDLGRELWNSTLHPGDDLGLLAKFTPPTVVNGKVYMATFSNKVCVFGLR